MFRSLATAPNRLALTWTDGDDVARLDVDLAAMTASITGSGPNGTVVTWHNHLETHA
jgi:hypothetical protein